MIANQLKTQPKAKIAEFDILRSIAILLLFCHHGGIYNFSFGGFSLRNLDPFIEFFLLGAFVFMAGYLSVRSLERSGLPRFLFTKLVRIYIPYVVALVLFVILLNVNLSGVDLTIHLFGGQMLLSPRFTTPVFTLWFIGVILAYYTLFAILYKSTRAFPLFLLMALLAFVLAFYARQEWAIITRRFFYYYLVYLTGVVCAHTGWLDRLTSSRYFLLDKLALAGIATGLLSAYRVQVSEQFSLPVVMIIDFYILATVLFVLSASRLVAQRWKGAGVFTSIAHASFFAYLFHRPIWQLLLEIYPADTAGEYFIYLVVIGSAIVLAVSYALQRGYNRLARLVKQQLVI